MRHEVTDADTAAALGSGDVAVLGTPRVIAWMEAATVRVAAALLEPGQTTVGTAIRVEHRRATAVGGSVEITATPPRDAGGRLLTFEVLASTAPGRWSRRARSIGSSSIASGSSRQHPGSRAFADQVLPCRAPWDRPEQPAPASPVCFSADESACAQRRPLLRRHRF